MTDTRITLPSPGLLRRYLKAHGWVASKLRSPDLKIFRREMEGEGTLEVIVPETVAVAQGERRIRHAVETLAVLEDRPLSEVVSAINGIGYDTIRERLPTDFRNSITLPVAERVIVRNRRLLSFAAVAEYARSDRSGAQSAADAFVERCRFGHTFHGSFGFTIHSPVGGRPEEDFLEAPPPVPAERQVIQRVMRGLSAVADEAPAYQPAVLADPAVGFDADMLESLAALLEGSRSEELTFEFNLSPEWQPDEDLSLQTQYVVNARVAELARDIAATLRNASVPSDSRISGYVTKLATKENPADLENLKGSREVTVEWLTGQKALSVRVLLEPSDYRVAWRAHGEHFPIEVEGNIERAGRGFIVRKARLISPRG
ncbi:MULTISPECIES: hypothetical protein [unclassified Bosea (in: a-proteobacteria)]|uniref:hypothetical protein n=1 Tax=unclassified Bosea (in: a-proteobacteria) TaxID=2653178 RepID=UPI000F762B83|nr:MULTISPECIES: hypothetical protein [unclassified Bosea (in: a-proteobacteria)]AZO77482.1 hypothetical protein BLM15_07550 [Bosea sp. Tri-49]RXT18087.1 hypothetical protein B5U98_22700 [Bosea sp. Tri-39]RXT32685.1 hypothetical protein B5U99_29045 [Bosea sp. Tri-54]